jgi:hypothetical protein
VAGSSRELNSRAKTGLSQLHPADVTGGPQADRRWCRRFAHGVQVVEFRANTGLSYGSGRRRMGHVGMARRTALVVPITNYQRLERLEKETHLTRRYSTPAAAELVQVGTTDSLTTVLLGCCLMRIRVTTMMMMMLLDTVNRAFLGKERFSTHVTRNE